MKKQNNFLFFFRKLLNIFIYSNILHSPLFAGPDCFMQLIVANHLVRIVLKEAMKVFLRKSFFQAVIFLNF